MKTIVKVAVMLDNGYVIQDIEEHDKYYTFTAIKKGGGRYTCTCFKNQAENYSYVEEWGAAPVREPVPFQVPVGKGDLEMAVRCMYPMKERVKMMGKEGG